MKVKWVNVYWPIGKWVDETGTDVKLSGNFKCRHNGNSLLCIMHVIKSSGGHGEGPITAGIPSFIHATTLAPYEVVECEYVEVSLG